MDNIGELDAPFLWNVPAPFFLEPSSGIIPAKKSLDIIVRIFPVDASVFVGEASCLVGEGEECSLPIFNVSFLFYFFMLNNFIFVEFLEFDFLS